MTDPVGELSRAYRTLLRERGKASALHDLPNDELVSSLEASMGAAYDALRRERAAMPSPGNVTGPELFETILRCWSGPAARPASIDKDVFRHLALVPYPAWQQLGREPRGVLVYRLARMNERPRVFGALNADRYQRLLKAHQKSLEAIITKRGHAVPPVYCGLFPTGSHNAEARTVDGGTLVLVNSGLINMLDRLARIIVASATVDDEPPLLDTIRTAVAVGELVNAHVVGGSSFLAQQLPPVPVNRQGIAFKRAQIALQFALAHEYGHVLLGHTGPGLNLVSVETSVASISLHTQSQEQEYEADRFAVEIIGPAILEPGSAQGEAVAVSGVLFFLFLDLVIRDVRHLLSAGPQGGPRVADNDNDDGSTHPSSGDRYNRARALLDGIATSPVAFDDADKLVSWYEKHRGTIAELLADGQRYARALMLVGPHTALISEPGRTAEEVRAVLANVFDQLAGKGD